MVTVLLLFMLGTSALWLITLFMLDGEYYKSVLLLILVATAFLMSPVDITLILTVGAE